METTTAAPTIVSTTKNDDNNTEQKIREAKSNVGCCENCVIQ